MFTTTPEKYSSLYAEQTYRYESDTERDITFTIEDVESGELLGVKKFYSTATVELNAGPIVRQNVLPKVAPYEDGFFEIERHGYANVQVTECLTGQKSEPTLMLLSEDSNGYAINSTLCMEGPIVNHEREVALISAFAPHARVLSIGESDMMLFTAPAGATVKMIVEQYVYGCEEAAATRSYTQVVQEPGMVAFNVVARPYLEQLSKVREPQLESIRLTLQVADTQNEEHFTDHVTIEYQVIDLPQHGVRIAWVSHKGTIEHYTFPVVKNKQISEDHIVSMTLASAFETTTIRNILAQIVKAPRMWVVTTTPDAPDAADMMITDAVTQTYTRAELLDKSLVATPQTALETMEIKIAYTA